MGLTDEQRRLLRSVEPGARVVKSPAPDWLVDECVAIGLAERIRGWGWRLTPAGIEVQKVLMERAQAR